MYVRLVFSPRASELGRYPRRPAASRTLVTVFSLTRARDSGLSAREAVDGWTPAISATSRRVAAFKAIANHCNHKRSPHAGPVIVNRL